MRRVTITLSAVLLLVALAPASSLARGHQQRRHHARTHHAKKHHAVLKRFGSDASSTSSTSSDTAGTVQSFSGGVLTITLGDGSVVSGVVNDNTELECTAPEETQTVHEDGDGGSGDQSSGDDNSGDSSGDQSATDDQGDTAEQSDDQGEDQNDDAAEETETENSCSTANLTPGAMVNEAELSISGSGSVWKKVELAS
jgi:hypothetical protein